MYHTDKVALEQQLDEHETAWPDYKDSSFLITIPDYVREPSGDVVNLHDTDQLADKIVQGQNGFSNTFMRRRANTTNEAPPCSSVIC